MSDSVRPQHVACMPDVLMMRCPIPCRRFNSNTSQTNQCNKWKVAEWV